MPLNFATKAFSYNLARFWASFCCKLYNNFAFTHALTQFFLADLFPIFSSILLLSFSLPFCFLYLLLFIPFYPLRMFWLQPFKKNLEMEHWSTRWLGLFHHQFCTKIGHVLFWYSSARIWLIVKMNTRIDGSVLALLAAYQKNLVSSENEDVTSGSMSPPSNDPKIRL